MFQPNSVIAGRYQVIRLVGQGGMSNLYLAYDRKYNNAIVVVKEMTAAYSDPKEQQMAVELFHREAKLLASLNHRHIPKVYDYFQFAGKYYLSMEFIDGEDLAQKLEATKGPLPEAQVLEWGEQIATVLFYLHKHDPPIVFRDVKPSNIMLCDQGVKLIDFGIARHFDQAKKGDTMRIGSPGYAPPEQYAAQTDPRSDIYALGVTLHHALTGRDPTGTQTPFLVPPARNINPALSEATAAMLARATQLSPEDRYQNILEMKNDIKHILSRGKQSTRVVGAPPPPPGPSVSSPPVSAPAVALSAAAATAAAAAAAASPASPGAAASSAAPASAPVVVVGPVGGAAKSAKKRPGKGMLLVALLLLIGGGGVFLAGPDGRQAMATQLRSFFVTLSHSDEKSPEGVIAEAVFEAGKTGNPQGLLALLGNAQMSALSQDKQALYRLNILAAEVAPQDFPPGIVHLLYPEELVGGPEEEKVFSSAASAVAAVNGSGGLDKQLLIVLPRAYSQGSLDSLIAKLSVQESKGGQRILILAQGAQTVTLSPESQGQTLLVVGEKDPGDGVPWLPSLPADRLMGSLFPTAAPAKGSSKLLWAAGQPPAGSKAEKVEFSDSADSLNRLLQRSAAEEATVVVEASRLKDLEGLSQEGRLLLLAIGAETLPELAPGAKAEALVLGSPLREATSSDLCLSPSTGLSPAQARIFDAVLLLATMRTDVGYTGITLTRLPKGKDQPGTPARYRWMASGWVPALGLDK